MGGWTDFHMLILAAETIEGLALKQSRGKSGLVRPGHKQVKVKVFQL